ncbi:MAG: MFS transporter [Chloroflexota bacterium]
MASTPKKSDTEAVLSRSQILSLYLPALILSIGTGIIAPVLPVFAKSFDIGIGLASMVLVGYQVGALGATLPAGYLMDKIGRRPILLAGPILMAISTILNAFAGSYWELVFYRFIGGAANQLWMQARLTVIADTAGVSQRARQITWMIGMQRGGTMLGPALGGFLASYDIRLPFLVHGFITLLAVIPSFIIIKETAFTTQAAAPGATAGKAFSLKDDWVRLAPALFTVQMITFLFVQFFATVCRGGEGGTFNLYAVYAYDIGPDALGLLNFAAGVVVFPIPFITGYFMDRYGRKFVVVPSFIIYGLALAAMGVTAYLNMPYIAYVIVFFIVQGCLSTTNGTMQVLGSDVAPPFARGLFFGIWRFIAQVGALLGPALFGIVAEYIDYGTAFQVTAVAALAVALLVGLILKETVQREPARAAAG